MLIEPQMLKDVRLIKPPYGLIMDIVDNEHFIELRVYENQVMAMNSTQQLIVMEYLHKVRKIIEGYGYKCYPLGAKGDPPRATK